MGNQQPVKQVPQQSASDKMFDMLFEFKTMAKAIKKESMNCEKQEKALTAKVKDAIEKNLPEMAKIHASDAIRKKNEARRNLVLASKLDAVYSRLQNAYQTQKVILINL